MDQLRWSRVFIYCLLGYAALNVTLPENVTSASAQDQDTETEASEEETSDRITLVPNKPFTKAKCAAENSSQCRIGNFNYCTKIPAESNKAGTAVEACYCSYNRKYYKYDTYFQCSVRDISSTVYDAIRNNKAEYTFYMVMIMFLVLVMSPAYYYLKAKFYNSPSYYMRSDNYVGRRKSPA